MLLFAATFMHSPLSFSCTFTLAKAGMSAGSRWVGSFGLWWDFVERTVVLAAELSDRRRWVIIQFHRQQLAAWLLPVPAP